MDELTLLQRLGSDAPEPREAALADAYRRLGDRMDSAAADAPRRIRPARPVRRIALIGIGAATATCTAVAVFAAGPTPTASAEVTRTLQHAASAVSAKPIATDGDVTTHVLQLVSSSSGRTLPSGELVEDSALLAGWTTSLHHAADGDGWIREFSRTRTITAWGPIKQKLLKEPEDGPSVDRSASDPNFWTGPTSVTPAQVRAMPRDPEALLRKFSGVTDPDSALEPDANRVIDAASALLGSGLADADLQAATYQALERLPGLTIDPHGADIDGRPGVAIGAVVSNGLQRIDLIIDPATGRFLGRTETDLTADNGAPAGTIEEGTATYPG